MLESDSVPAGQYLTVVAESYDAETGMARLALTYGALKLAKDGAA